MQLHQHAARQVLQCLRMVPGQLLPSLHEAPLLSTSRPITLLSPTPDVATSKLAGSYHQSLACSSAVFYELSNHIGTTRARCCDFSKAARAAQCLVEEVHHTDYGPNGNLSPGMYSRVTWSSQACTLSRVRGSRVPVIRVMSQIRLR